MPFASCEVRRRFWGCDPGRFDCAAGFVAAGVSTGLAGRGSTRLAACRRCRSSPNSARRLSVSDREQIVAGLAAGWSFRPDRPSVGSGAVHDYPGGAGEPGGGVAAVAVPAGRRSSPRGMVPRWLNYSPSAAQRKAEQRARRPKTSKLAASPGLAPRSPLGSTTSTVQSRSAGG